MSKVVIVVEASGNWVCESPTTLSMVSALKAALATAELPVSVEVVTVAQLESDSRFRTPQPASDQEKFGHKKANLFVDNFPIFSRFQESGTDREDNPKSKIQNPKSNDLIICPLTLNLPAHLPLPAVFSACRDVADLRQHVAQQLQVAVGDGHFWLPVVLTAKGPIYGEAIALDPEVIAKELPIDFSRWDLKYQQPFHLADAIRQPLYQMAHQLLQLLSAPPATYLVQFGLENFNIYFDRVFPFPAAPALASVGVQQPDLFTCHWHCLTGLPIIDLTIAPKLGLGVGRK